ncbi:MAG: hypothetical protein AABX04_01250 [Nanoarchaeota archaeon]
MKTNNKNVYLISLLVGLLSIIILFFESYIYKEKYSLLLQHPFWWILFFIIIVIVAIFGGFILKSNQSVFVKWSSLGGIISISLSVFGFYERTFVGSIPITKFLLYPFTLPFFERLHPDAGALIFIAMFFYGVLIGLLIALIIYLTKYKQR